MRGRERREGKDSREGKAGEREEMKDGRLRGERRGKRRKDEDWREGS